MRRVCLAIGAAVLSWGCFAGCGNVDTTVGSGAVSEAEAKDPNTGKAAMDKMKAEMGSKSAPAGGPSAGEDAMAKMRRMGKK